MDNSPLSLIREELPGAIEALYEESIKMAESKMKLKSLLKKMT